MSMTVPNNAPMAPMPSNSNQMYPSNRNLFNEFAPGMKTLSGYFINDESEIIPKYIPMDGSISFFPYRNLSKIVIKQWDANGLQTLSYVLAPPPGSNPDQNQQPAQDDQDKLPLTPQVQPRPDPVMETLQSINSGLASTFGQIGTTLQAIQQEVSQLNNLITNPVYSDLGGRG